MTPPSPPAGPPREERPPRAPITMVPAEVLGNEPIALNLYRMRLRLPAGWGPLHAGQYVSITLEPPWDDTVAGDGGVGLLRRPFSVAGVGTSRGRPTVDLVYACVGKVTHLMVALAPGSRVDVLGPAGTAFPRLPDRHHLLVGGGRGIAPMLLAARELAAAGVAFTLIYGTRTRAEWMELGQDLEPHARRATEDGSGGATGTVIDVLDSLGETGDAVVQACGPHGMLAAVAQWAARRDLPCWVSVEEIFGCSVGICGGCAVPVRTPPGPYERFLWACRDGAVVAAETIDWDAWRMMHA